MGALGGGVVLASDGCRVGDEKMAVDVIRTDLSLTLIGLDSGNLTVLVRTIGGDRDLFPGDKTGIGVEGLSRSSSIWKRSPSSSVTRV
jgi:hypothetical protein